MDQTDGIFTIDGASFVPSLDARAQWYDQALHGGPVAALFARQFEAEIDTSTSMIGRLTVDILRPVPVAPLTVAVDVVRRGRRIQVFTARMRAGQTEVAAASALAVRRAPVTVPDHPRRELPASPSGIPAARLEPVDGRYFHTTGVEMRFLDGAFRDPGPATVWMRLTQPIVTGEATSPLQLVAAVGDFGNGVSRVLSDDYVFMNPDVSLHLHRHPIGEWVALRSRTDIDDEGVGLAQSELLDERGAIGHALQVLYVDTVAGFGDR